jgi:TPR repeat protein
MAYYSGDGVERDPVEAHKWLLLASDAGNMQAQSRLQEVVGPLSDKQNTAARRAADSWNTRHFDNE